jgi:hypothetical protein
MSLLAVFPRHYGCNGMERQLRPTVILVGIIAAAAVAGILISMAQHSPLTNQPPPPIPSATPIPSEPVDAAGISAADDSATRQVIVFGGVGDYDNTWLWDGTAWTLAHPELSPPGRYSASAAYDPEAKVVLLFGGWLAAGPGANDTWEWDGRTWHEIDTGLRGPPAGGASMAWDADRGEMVLLTEPANAPTHVSETWTWAGTHWSLHTAGDLPTSNIRNLLGFDPVSGSMIAVGCCQTADNSPAPVASTYGWNGTNWRLLATNVAPLNGPNIALDPVRNRLIVWASDDNEMFTWSGTAWSPLPTAQVPLEPAAEIADPDTQQFVILAPHSSNSQPGPLLVWSLRGTDWMQLSGSPVFGR